MMRTRRTWWLAFSACAAAVLAGMGWVTAEMMRLDRAELEARVEATHQETLRLALWRMDSWFAPRLAREAARPYFDYEAFYPQQQSYTKGLSKIDPGEVLTQSPLLTFDSQFVRLHFQASPDGRITSPQVPAVNLRDVAMQSGLHTERLLENITELQRVSGLMSPEEMVQCVAAVEPTLTTTPVAGAGADPEPAQTSRGGDWARRQSVYVQNAMVAPEQTAPAAGSRTGVQVGPLVPIWSEPPVPEAAELMFVRRVRVTDREYLQGFVCDWPALTAALCREVDDLLPDARLVPVATPVPDTDDGRPMLATIPARLERTTTAVAAGPPARRPGPILTISWLAVLAGLAAVAVTLRASITAADRRSRFASAVTHELRTPLTTFRMYSEMLADGMVKDEPQRRVYLDTLKHESERLSTLVENVLAYARIERGQTRIEPERMELGRLLEAVTPALRRCADRAGMTLEITHGSSAEVAVHVDADAIGQILLNLVENACKYARDAEDRTVHVEAAIADGRLVFEVRDHGPGISREHERRVFAAFDRGSRASGDATPGVGLGLALARGLARGLGGDLRLAATNGTGNGARFVLTLPMGTR
ncbi:MAG: HAMP domain-containing histidine kinase [Planctomycetes bacterium]|nr:HAMP domain-containing histidine kinase [Planctomycetota bacterium]